MISEADSVDLVKVVASHTKYKAMLHFKATCGQLILVVASFGPHSYKTIAQLQQERADPEVWNAFFDNAVELAGIFGLRRASHSIMVDRGTVCENVPADITDTPSSAVHVIFVLSTCTPRLHI